MPEWFWNAYARFYDLLLLLPAYRRHIKRLVELVEFPNSNVIDVGCGTGNYALALQRARHNVIGIDGSLAMASRTRAKGVPCWHRDFMHYHLVARYDCVLSINALYMVRDRGEALRGFCRMLGPDGILILSHPAFLNRRNVLGRLTSQLERSGFKVESVERAYILGLNWLVVARKL